MAIDEPDLCPCLRDTRDELRGGIERGRFPMQNLPKITPSRSSAPNSPVIRFSCSWASRSSSAKRSSWRSRCRVRVGLRKVHARAPKRLQVPLARDELRLARALPAGQPQQRRAQAFDARAGLGRQPHAGHRRRDRRPRRRLGAGRSTLAGSSLRSILLTTRTIGTAAGSRRAMSSSSRASSGFIESTRCTTTSALATVSQVRAIPIRSTSSWPSRSPAVSTMLSGTPSI